MPMFDYRCDVCQHEFEAFVRSSGATSCPKCSASAVTRRLSSFAVGASSKSAGGSYLGRAAGSGGFGCRPGCACH